MTLRDLKIKKPFSIVEATLGQYLGLQEYPPTAENKINIGNTNPTPNGQRTNNKSKAEKQNILLYPLLGIDLPKFTIYELNEPFKGYNISTECPTIFKYECREGGGRTGSYILSMVRSFVKFPGYDEIVNGDLEQELHNLVDSTGQRIYGSLIGKTVNDIKETHPEIYARYVNFPLTFTLYNKDINETHKSVTFDLTNTITAPSEFTRLSCSTQPVARYISEKCTPNFNRGINSSSNPEILPLFQYKREVDDYGTVTVPAKNIRVDDNNAGFFELGAKMFYNCTNLIHRDQVKPIHTWENINTDNIVRYVNENPLLPNVTELFEETANQVSDIVLEIKKINSKKQTKYDLNSVNVKLLQMSILELKSKFGNNMNINSKIFAEKFHESYTAIMEDKTYIDQNQVLHYKRAERARAIHSAFDNYKGKTSVYAFSWCVEQLLSRMIYKNDLVNDLVDIGINVKDKRITLSEESKRIIREKHRVDGKLVSYVTDKPYDDENKLEFSHKIAIGLGKYIFNGDDDIHNIVLVERVLNRTMGQVSVDDFKGIYSKNKQEWDFLINISA